MENRIQNDVPKVDWGSTGIPLSGRFNLKSRSTVGIVGTGFIAKGLLYTLEHREDLRVGPVLTRRARNACSDFPQPQLLTQSLEKLLRNSDLIVECTGDPLHAAEIIDAALAHGLPVVTSDVEFHVTLGSCFEGRGYLTESEGDQPGVLAALRAELLEMGFTPTAYGNLKRFYNPNPTLAEMQKWGRRLGIRLPQVTAFTDGSKIQMEMALVGNAFGAELVRPGMCGLRPADADDFGGELGKLADAWGRPIVDYAVGPDFPSGVMITATQDDPRQTPYLDYLKLGKGPHYTFLRPYHLCHLEIVKTIRRALEGAPPLLTNGPRPEISVAAVAKRALRPGDRIERGMGSFETRGICINAADEPGHVPLGLLSNAEVLAPIEPGELLRFDQLDLPHSFGLGLWREHRREAENRVRRDAYPDSIASSGGEPAAISPSRGCAR